MAKQQNIPEAIQKQFNKIQFHPGEAVYFTWLGSKKYGYVTAIKQTNWGIQYTVEANNTRYPCGIQIKGYKTTYTTGCVHADETRSIDAAELARRCQNGSKSTYSEVIRDTPRPKDESRSSDSNKRESSSATNRKTKSNTKRSTRVENDVKPSNNGVQRQHTKTRKNSELDEAIQKQRDFLSGFVKRD